MCDKRKYPFLAAVLFAATPACIVGLVVAVLTHWFLGFLVGLVVFMFGMDVLLNGVDSDAGKVENFEDSQ